MSSTEKDNHIRKCGVTPEMVILQGFFLFTRSSAGLNKVSTQKTCNEINADRDVGLYDKNKNARLNGSVYGSRQVGVKQ